MSRQIFRVGNGVPSIMNHNLAICFTNFGPYHLARLEALGKLLSNLGGRLIAYEMAGVEEKYPWQVDCSQSGLSYQHFRLFPGRSLESLSSRECRMAILSRLDQDQPTAIAAVGYVRPESLAMLHWAKSNGSLRILLSETQRIDNPRVWWKEAIKSYRVSQFQAGLVGGETHRDYLAELGLWRDRVHLGYNAVGNEHIDRLANTARSSPSPLNHPYFLSVCRFAPEKNIEALLSAFAKYKSACQKSEPWKLVIAGDGELKESLLAKAESLGIAGDCVWPGFLSLEDLVPWYVHAGAFVLPSMSEPWGLVVNEAAISGAPLILSERCGSTSTFLPDNGFPNGWKFDPENVESLTDLLLRMDSINLKTRKMMGETSRRIANLWGPDRFAHGLIEALKSAEMVASSQLSTVAANDRLS